MTFLGLLLVGTTTFGQGSFGDIIGTLVDSKNEAIFGAQVSTTSGDAVYRAITDPDGRFRISAIPAGIYTLTYKQDTTVFEDVAKVEVVPDGFGDAGTVVFISNNLDLVKSDTLEEFTVDGNRIKLTKGVISGIKLARKDILQSSRRGSITGLVTGLTPEIRQTEDGSLVFRGARKNDYIYYIDGIKVTGGVANIPSASMGYVMVYTGGIPAKYGDTTGGVIVVETISYNDLYRDWKSKQ